MPESGNPTSYYNGTRWDFDWVHGRQLARAESDAHSISYTYDMDGIRDSKTVDGVTYHYDTLNGKVVRQTWTQNNAQKVFDIIYDANSQPYACVYEGNKYYYVLNQQGDVIRVVNSSGAAVAAYSYDPWGNIISKSGTLADVNPIRYRGYYYDTESGLYYLQSRYYDPSIGRFINADSFASTGQGFLGYNMFTYCLNNPVCYSDSTGFAAGWTNVVAISDCSHGFFPGYAEYISAINRRNRQKAEIRQSFVRILQAMTVPTRGGNTFSAGVTVSTSYDTTGGGWSGVVSADGGGNYAIQTSDTFLASTGLGTGAGVVMTWTNARYVSDLDGSSTIYGGTIVSCCGVSVDYISFIPASEPEKNKWGLSISILIGAGADVHIGQSYTTTVASWNPLLALIDIITGG